MAVSARQQLRWWGAFIIILLLTLWFLGDILLPFVVGSAIAYLLDPVVDRLERLGASRVAATALVSGSALLLLLLLIILLFPLIVQQVAQLIDSLPRMATMVRDLADQVAPDLMTDDSPLWDAFAEIGGVLKAHAVDIGKGVLTSLAGAINGLLFILVVPVVMIYMLADWDHVVARIDGWLPRDHADVLRRLTRDIDVALSGFVRGQMTVCAILATFYSVMLLVVGLDYGLAVGVLAGFLSFIPFVGAIGGGVLAIGLALFQFWSEPLWIVAVTVIFLVGQVLEGNVLTPRLVGRSVGIHPVWLLFALSAFGALFGFVGMLVAVPAAAAAGVLLRFAVAQYLSSRIFLGGDRSQ